MLLSDGVQGHERGRSSLLVCNKQQGLDNMKKRVVSGHAHPMLMSAAENSLLIRYCFPSSSFSSTASAFSPLRRQTRFVRGCDNDDVDRGMTASQRIKSAQLAERTYVVV